MTFYWFLQMLNICFYWYSTNSQLILTDSQVVFFTYSQRILYWFSTVFSLLILNACLIDCLLIMHWFFKIIIKLSTDFFMILNRFLTDYQLICYWFSTDFSTYYLLFFFTDFQLVFTDSQQILHWFPTDFFTDVSTDSCLILNRFSTDLHTVFIYWFSNNLILSFLLIFNSFLYWFAWFFNWVFPVFDWFPADF